MSDLGVTSGPFEIRHYGDGSEVVKPDGSDMPWYIASFHFAPDNGSPAANARAFAEAPAMIQVLQQLVAGDPVNIDEVREILVRIENF